MKPPTNLRALVRARQQYRKITTMLLTGALLGAGLVALSWTHPAPALAAPGSVCEPENGATGSLHAKSLFVPLRNMINDANRPLTQAHWDESMASYQAMGIENVIIQYVASYGLVGDEWSAWFPNTDAQGAIFSPPSAASLTPDFALSLERILAAAKSSGMTVTVGLGLNEKEWFSNAAGKGWKDASWLKEQAALANRSASLIWEAYGEEFGDTISGWYLPYEVEGYHLSHPSTGASMPEALDPYIEHYAKTVSEHVVAISGKTQVIVSPLFSANTQNPTGFVEQNRLKAWTTAWAKVFRETKVSVVAPQDGAGSGKNTPTDITRWFTATTQAQSVSGNPNAQVWGNAEIYRDQNPGAKNMGVNQISQNLKAMRAGGATQMAMFSAVSVESIAGHSGAARKAPFVEAYRRWVAGECAPATKLSAPRNLLASTGTAGSDAEPASSLNSSTTVKIAWNSSIATAPPERIDQATAGYQVVRDGRVIAEYGRDSGPEATMFHTDQAMQPGRTYVYQVHAFDSWGTFSLKPATVQVTVPWTSAALAVRDGDEGVFNVARNAPFTVTRDPDAVTISGQELSPIAADGELIPSATYGDEITDAGAIGNPEETRYF